MITKYNKPKLFKYAIIENYYHYFALELFKYLGKLLNTQKQTKGISKCCFFFFILNLLTV